MMSRENGNNFSSKKRRILYVTPWSELGGAEVMLLDIVKYHNRSRFEPIVCFLKPGPLVESVRQMGLETVIIPVKRLRYFVKTVQAFNSIRSLIRNLG